MRRSKKLLASIWILLMVAMQASKENHNHLHQLQLPEKTVFLPIVEKPPVFLETFDGDFQSPRPFTSNNWDVTIHSRDVGTWETLEPMQAAHGHDCSPPPNRHTVVQYQDTVFVCKNHLMTAINASGYGAIYITPSYLVDFSKGEAVIQFDMSTARTSMRDWIDIWITPYEDHLQLPLRDWMPDLSGEPRRALQISMGVYNGKTTFGFTLINNFNASDFPGQPLLAYEDFLVPSAMRRDRFELRIAKNYLQFGMPGYQKWWIDERFAPLDWNKGVVQIGHHSYNPAKDCSNCSANTWHWDNIKIQPSIPFTIIPANQRSASEKNGTVVVFSTPAPQQAHLRFAGIGQNLEVSFNNGQTWVKALAQAQEQYDEGSFWSYWMPIPANTKTVQFRGQPWWGGSWLVRDISIWSLQSNLKQ